MGNYLVSERRACRVLRVPRPTYCVSKNCLDPRTGLTHTHTLALADAHPARSLRQVRYGYRKIRVLLNREGWEVGKYLVYRLYTEEGLTMKRMKPARKRKAALPR